MYRAHESSHDIPGLSNRRIDLVVLLDLLHIKTTIIGFQMDLNRIPTGSLIQPAMLVLYSVQVYSVNVPTECRSESAHPKRRNEKHARLRFFHFYTFLNTVL